MVKNRRKPGHRWQAGETAQDTGAVSDDNLQDVINNDAAADADSENAAPELTNDVEAGQDVTR